MKIPEAILLATNNPDKVAEWRQRTALAFDWEPLPDVEETADSYVGNAMLKAQAAAKLTGRIALGDDAGIEIDAYDGAPGLFTRRWAMQLGGWEEARAVLGREVSGSRARFHCGLALAWPDGTVFCSLGTTTGTIIAATVDGHGLEPCFRADETTVPLPSLSDADWAEIHYRSRAWHALIASVNAR